MGDQVVISYSREDQTYPFHQYIIIPHRLGYLGCGDNRSGRTIANGTAIKESQGIGNHRGINRLL